MDDLRAQLDALRARIRQIEQRQEEESPAPSLGGHDVTTPHGCHLELEVDTERHGGFHFSRLEELPPSALDELSGVASPCGDPKRIAFLDTETTGLAGGTGTVAFLVGVGRLTDRGFRVRQYFMRDFGEEASMLQAVAEDLAGAELLVTYNGKSYDEPLLASRYVLARIRPPFSRLAHLDLLHGARRLWKLRFDSCRLQELEAQILGYTREGDVPGGLIPRVYFDYLRTRRPGHLHAVLHHNVLDILTLAALTAILPLRYQNRDSAVYAGELVGLGRWLQARGDRSEAIPLFERAIKRMEFDRLPVSRRRDVFVELAKHYEHVCNDPGRALEMALEVAMIDDADVHHRRIARLERRLTQRSLTADKAQLS